MGFSEIFVSFFDIFLVSECEIEIQPDKLKWQIDGDISFLK